MNTATICAHLSIISVTTMLLYGITVVKAETGFVPRYDPGNPVNPANQYQPTNPFNPANRYHPDNPLNPANRYSPSTPFAPLDGTSGRKSR